MCSSAVALPTAGHCTAACVTHHPLPWSGGNTCQAVPGRCYRDRDLDLDLLRLLRLLLRPSRSSSLQGNGWWSQGKAQAGQAVLQRQKKGWGLAGGA
jgi:hypothetical protein